MTDDPEFWHLRFTQQAQWTRQAREMLFQAAGMRTARRVLEVGCGTGAILQELSPAEGESAAAALPSVFGLDIRWAPLQTARISARTALLSCADAHHLPFADHTFEIVFCHFTLMWIAQPAVVIAEMRRVTLPGGWVLLLAEPDYGGRLDYPPTLARFGEWQTQALRTMGADPLIGRSLGALLLQAGLKHVHSGVLGGQWQHTQGEDGDLEWQVFERDLAALDQPPPPAQVAALRTADIQARRSGSRLLYVPTFYAAGIV
jgi:ubiquinone/menaquinone biosynthesis C-methylase UbiE